jgi:hypothetical protein
MNWGCTEYIDRIEILESGELFLGIAGKSDPRVKGFKSTKLIEWTPSQWFFDMVEMVRTGVGVDLILCDSIQWKGISDPEKAALGHAKP